MINLSEFKVDKTILLINIFQTYLSTIASRLEPALLNKIDSIGKCVINYLHTKNISTNKKTFSNYSELYKIVTEDSELSALSENIFKTPEFQSIYDETVAYKDKVQNEWEGSKQNIENIFENHLKIDVPDKAVSVNILHPYCYDGTNNQNNEIYYGHYKGIDNKNYNLVYLMHEYMHCIFPYKSDWNSQQKYLCHSLIELATDNELRVRLGDCSIRYDVGHEELT
ncbi:MAG: hypothetical protein LBM02_04325, partial [Lachnospiraceae bacterium]|nr:hypothetical protein [Lachnospiraceae bacterium]